MNKKDFWERFGQKYNYKLEKTHIVYWNKDGSGSVTKCMIGRDDYDYENIDAFIKDYEYGLRDFGDKKPKYNIGDIVIYKHSEYQIITTEIKAIGDEKDDIRYYFSTGDWKKEIDIIGLVS